MAKKCRILEGGLCEITQGYSNNHRGIDIVGKDYTLKEILAHSDGVVVDIRKNCKGHEEGGSYGNFVKVKHNDEYYTLYAHLDYGSVKWKKNDKVKAKDKIGYMGDTGYAFGKHLHFEVRDKRDTRIDPTPYLDKDLPKENPVLKYVIGDFVSIDGVYVSSDSDKLLKPLINHGKITKIINAKNPYLLNDGNIGWVNDKCITGRYDEGSLLVLVKNTIAGVYGNGEERKQKLGGRYTEVQNQVNLNYKYGTTAPDKVRIY